MINQTPNPLGIFNGMKPTLFLRLLYSDSNVSKRLANNTRIFSFALYLLHSPLSQRPQQAKTSRSASLTGSITIISLLLATERERQLTTGKRAERTVHDFRCPICRSAIGQAGCLICARRRQLAFPFCCQMSLFSITGSKWAWPL